MSCWTAIQFRSKGKQHQPVIGDTEHFVMDDSDLSDLSDVNSYSSTHQLVERNVRALENMSDDSHCTVRERVTSWLESSSQSIIDCGIDCNDRKGASFTYRLLQRLALTSKAKFEYAWQEPRLPWFERCESSYSGLSGVD